MELLWVESGSPCLREVWPALILTRTHARTRVHTHAYKASICFSCLSRVRDYCWKGMQTVMSLKCVMSKNKDPTPSSVSPCNKFSPCSNILNGFYRPSRTLLIQEHKKVNKQQLAAQFHRCSTLG